MTEKRMHKIVNTVLILSIFLFILSAPSSADVEIKGLILDQYQKRNNFDKIKFRIIQAPEDKSGNEWITAGRIISLPVLDMNLPELHLFDRATIILTSFDGEAAIKEIAVYETGRVQVPLPMELYIKTRSDKQVYKRGEKAKATLTIQNVGKRSIQLPLQSAQQFDFVVKNGRGHVIWSWSRDRMFASMLQTMIFARRERKRFTVEWPLTDDMGNPVPPGVYVIEGSIATDPPYPGGKAVITVK